MQSRNFFSGLHSLIQAVLVLTIIFFIYRIGMSYHHRVDLSEGKVYSLAPQSIQVLESLKSLPIRVYGFFAENERGRGRLENLLKEYGFHHPRFSYEFYDPDRALSKAKKYRIDAYDTLVVELNGRYEKTKQISEEAITNLLIKLRNQKAKSVVFASGHGGPDLKEGEKREGAKAFYDALTEAHYEVRETVLLREGIPDHTDLFVFLGPQVDLLPEELQAVKGYLERGGSVLMLVDPVDSGEGKNLQQFLLNYGVQLGNDVIIDKVSKLFGADYLIPLVSEYRPHEITRDFRTASFFPIARSVRKSEKVPEKFQVEEIAWTGVGSWAEKDLKALEDGEAEFKAGEDVQGPVPMAAAVSKQGSKMRLVVFGDSEFATNGYLHLSGNKDLLFNSVAWLTKDESAITLRPRERRSTPLYLKESDQSFLFYVPVVGFPFLFLSMGTAVFFWRRRFS